MFDQKEIEEKPENQLRNQPKLFHTSSDDISYVQQIYNYTKKYFYQNPNTKKKCKIPNDFDIPFIDVIKFLLLLLNQN